MRAPISITTLAAAVIFTGCTLHRQIRTDFNNENLQSPEGEERAAEIGKRVFERHEDFFLAHVEFDDQGQFWEKQREGERNQLDALEAHIHEELRLNRAKYANGAVIIAFTHGWNNNAEEGNKNLANFRRVMQLLANEEKYGRQMIGVYLSWRGLRVRKVPVVAKIPNALTYWDRKETAHNIGQRSMGETLKRLSFLKDDIVERGERRRHRDSNSRLVLVGHSFGGAAVYSGVSRFFEDELIKVQRSNYSEYVDRNWDLVVLINPAFEALRYNTIHRYSSKIPPRTPNKFVHLPRLLVVGAENDGATGSALPLGQMVGDMFRPRQHTKHLDQPKQMITALGHYTPFMTHRLVLSEDGNSGKLKAYNDFENLQNYAGANQMAAFAPTSDQRFLRRFDAVFAPDQKVKRVLPFMVVQADKEIVDGHSGIWEPPLTRFIVDFITAREEAVQDLVR